MGGAQTAQSGEESHIPQCVPVDVGGNGCRHHGHVMSNNSGYNSRNIVAVAVAV